MLVNSGLRAGGSALVLEKRLIVKVIRPGACGIELSLGVTFVVACLYNFSEI